MKKIILLLIVLSLPTLGYAQNDWKVKLQEDIVSIENDQYTTTDTQQITFQNGAKIKIQTNAVSPTSVMSRDTFLSIYNTMSLFTIFGILTEAGLSLNDVTFEEIESPTERPEIRLDFNMTENGLNMVVTTSDGTENEVMTWEEFFTDK